MGASARAEGRPVRGGQTGCRARATHQQVVAIGCEGTARVPYTHFLAAATRQQLARAVERHVTHRLSVAGQRAHAAAGAQVPNSQRAVLRAARRVRTIGRDRNGKHGGGVAEQEAHARGVGHRPQPQRRIARRREDVTAVGGGSGRRLHPPSGPEGPARRRAGLSFTAWRLHPSGYIQAITSERTSAQPRGHARASNRRIRYIRYIQSEDPRHRLSWSRQPSSQPIKLAAHGPDVSRRGVRARWHAATG